MRANAIDTKGPTSLLFKSPWGFGKTLAAASFALSGPTYLAYWDKKKPVELKTYFSKFGAKGRTILDNLEYDVFGAHNAGKYLDKIISMIDDCRYTAFITDSVTNLTSGAVNWSLGFDAKGKPQPKRADNPQMIIPDWDEYKTETSLASQSLDLCRTLPCHIIWTAHPVPGIKLEGSGSSMRVTKVNSIVTYGSKVAGIVPGQFTEIYQFIKTADYSTSPVSIRYKCSTEAVGDDYAKTALGLPQELDFTDRLFYEVWLEALQQVEEETKKENTDELKPELVSTVQPSINPFANRPTNQKKWNPEKGDYE